MLHRLVFRCGTGFAWLGFYLVRLGESILPQAFLSTMLWPFAALLGGLNLAKMRRVKAAWARFPRAWRPRRSRFFIEQLIGLTHARMVYCWPDKLPNVRWLRRCRLQGEQDAARLRRATRPIVFGSLHFGPFETLPYWLRAHGFPATVVVGRPAPRRRLKHRQYSLSAPPDVPVVVSVTDSAGLREAMEKARHLLIFMDVDRGKQMKIPFEDHLMRLASGAIRLAIGREAELIPCLIVATHPWRYTLHLGQSLPCRKQPGRAEVLDEIAAQLIEQFRSIIVRYPAQCGPRLLSCISHAPSLPETA